MDQILPVIDTAQLQEKANEFAMKGAIKVIEEFYTGYNSPYKKAIEENLINKGVDSYRMELPDILAILNESISNEIDKIANTAVAKTFVPMVARFLTRQAKEIKMSDILKEFIETAKTYDGPDRDDYELRMHLNAQYNWYEVTISDGIREYTMTLHSVHEDRNKPQNQWRWQVLSLPNDGNSHKHTMKVSGDGYTLELPFTRDVLKDEFQSFMAGILIANSHITLDMDYFEDHLFPERCHC